METFICKHCGSTFNEHDRFCPRCIKDDELELEGYCERCKKITAHEDGFNIKTGEYNYFCMECPISIISNKFFDDRQKG